MAQYLTGGLSIQLLLGVLGQFFLGVKGLDLLMNVLFLFKEGDELLIYAVKLPPFCIDIRVYDVQAGFQLLFAIC